MEERNIKKHQATHSHNVQHMHGKSGRRNVKLAKNRAKPRSKKNRKHNNKKKLFNILSCIFACLAHAAFILIVIWSIKFSGIDTKSFVFLYIILALLLIINDIILFVGIKYRDFIIKCVATTLSIFLLIGGIFGSSFVGRISGSTGKMIQNDSKEQYETVNVAYVTYGNSNITTLNDLIGKKIGVIKSLSDNEDTTSVGKKKLEQENISVSYVEYDSLVDTYMGLVNGEVDAAILPSSYKTLLSQNSGYEKHLEKTTDIDSVTAKVQTGESSGYSKDITKEPFTVLLIGYAQESENYGLADSVILCSVNPLTYQTVMVSLARDSYVPICGGGSDKLTHARGQSRACLIQTVEDLMSEKVDFYMEINFKGVVDVVDAVGGIVINNPVEFVGQSADIERGNMTVLVPAGELIADGEMALAFARERHAYAEGDFARQQHQQEVIKAIVDKILGLNNVSSALKVLDAAGNNFSTNLSMNQITSFLNYVLTHGRNNGVSTMNQIQIFNTRVTGYSSWHWNEGAQLALWIYRLWNGSIKDNKWLIDKVKGETSVDDQLYKLTFIWKTPYSESYNFPDTYDEEQIHEQLPTTVPDLVGMSLSEVQTWASDAGVSLSVNYVQTTDTSLEGKVKAQSPSSGTSLDDCGHMVTIDVYATKTQGITIPTFTSKEDVKTWATTNGMVYAEDTTPWVEGATEGAFAGTKPAAGSSMNKGETITALIYGSKPESGGVTIPTFTSKEDVKTWATTNGMVYAEDTTPWVEGATEGAFAGTKPAAGSSMNKGETITALIYGSKPESGGVTIPTFTSKEDVKTWATTNGMVYAEDTTPWVEGATEGAFAGTNPAAGSSMNKGETITALTYAAKPTE